MAIGEYLECFPSGKRRVTLRIVDKAGDEVDSITLHISQVAAAAKLLAAAEKEMEK